MALVGERCRAAGLASFVFVLSATIENETPITVSLPVAPVPDAGPTGPAGPAVVPAFTG